MGNDIVATYAGDNVTDIDFGSNADEPSSGNVYKIVFIGQAD